MKISHEDIMKAPAETRERFGKWLGVSVKRRAGESEGAFKFRFSAACIRALKKGKGSRPKDEDEGVKGEDRTS